MTLIVKQAEAVVAEVATAPIYKFPTGFIMNTQLTLNEGSNTADYYATSNSFWTGSFNRDSPNTYNWTSKYGICVDANPITLIDLEGQSGVLTNIITPTGETGAVITTTYEVDGRLYSYQHTMIGGQYHRRIWGGNYDGLSSITDSTTAIHPGRGSAADFGWSTSGIKGLFSPLQNRGSGIGIPYTNSLKVTIQSTEFVATEYRNYGGAAYVRT